MTMNRMIDTLKLVLALIAVSSPLRAAAPVESLNDADVTKTWDVSNGSLETAAVNGSQVLRWHINAGETSRLGIKDLSFLDRFRNYNRLQCEIRIASGEISGCGVDIRGHVSGPRAEKVHEWNLAILTTDKGVWHGRNLDLTRPNWFPWDDPDDKAKQPFFRFEALALARDTVIELRNIKLFAAPLFLKPDYELPVTWPVKTTSADGSVTYTSTYKVLNTSGTPATIEAKVTSNNTRFKVAFNPARQDVKNGASAEFTLTATIGKDDIAATPELYAEPLQLDFSSAHAPETPVRWQGELVRPLTPGYKRQVIAPDSDIAFLREKLTAGDAAAKEITDSTRLLSRADEFLKIRLDSIPNSHSHPSNGLPEVPGTNRAWKPGAFMPEIMDPETGQREAGTAGAAQFWKEYLGFGGATENLGQAYLLTGDEKYAAKAVELFELYGKQYRDLQWSEEPSILSSSRTARFSTYGSNWFFKWHCKLLSMISASQAWAKADKKLIYEGFVLPYATEIMKFPGGIGNMTDITNCNLLLLGLVFDDATIVRFALLSDPGLIRRLNDLTADGFSSEGRPLNYHFAAMDEYLPALTYLVQSGLKLNYNKDKLLSAMRMPFQRATLWGAVPLTGDMGRGWQSHGTTLADQLLSIFPDELWLADIGSGSTLSAKARMLRTGGKPDPDAWRRLVSDQPQLFAQAGLAILRTGAKPENQIMVTLDYGRNVFHSALDRNQITLAAFGKMFTQGVGSLYNAGTGGVTLNPDKQLQSFINHGSLGHNLVMIDGKDQLPAVGQLLKWSAKGDFQYAVSKVAGIAPGVSHTRAVVLRKGVVIVLDCLESADQHTYDWIYHNFGELKLTAGWKSTVLTAPLGNTANLDNVVEPSKLEGAGPLRLTWDLTRQVIDTSAPQTAPAVGLALYQLPVRGGQWYTGFTGMNNTNTAILADKTASLFQRVRGTRVDFVTVLEPYINQPKVRSIAAAKNGGVTITMDGASSFTVTLDQLR